MLALSTGTKEFRFLCRNKIVIRLIQTIVSFYTINLHYWEDDANIAVLKHTFLENYKVLKVHSQLYLSLKYYFIFLTNKNLMLHCHTVSETQLCYLYLLL